MTHRDFVLVSAIRLAETERALDAATATWCQAWGVARDGLVVECARAWEAPRPAAAAPWRQSWGAGEGALALAWPVDMAAQVQRLLFASDRRYPPTGGIAQTAVAAGEAAWLALLKILATALLADGKATEDVAPPPTPEWRRGSGALLIVVRIGQHVCHGLLNGAAVAALNRSPIVTPRKLAPVSYPDLLSPLALRLPVALGSAQVDIGSLMRMSVGDVIRLDTAADSALNVMAPGVAGNVLFDGFLGRSGAELALELAPHDITNGVKDGH